MVKPMELGGLGIGDLRLSNEALLSNGCAILNVVGHFVPWNWTLCGSYP